MNEISIMEKLSHQNVIALKKKFLREKEIVLILPRFQFSLEMELERRSRLNFPFQISDILMIFSEIAEGLNHIHSSGIAHRDLKVCFLAFL